VRSVFGEFPADVDGLGVRNGREQLKGPLEAVLGRKVDGFQLDFAGFNLGKIKNVVEEVEKGVSRRVNETEVFALLGIQGGFGKKGSHAQDAVHGGADLVAHVGKELALGTIGRFGSSFGVAESFFFLFALGGVHEASDHADDATTMVDGMGPDFDRKTGTIGAPENIVQFVIVQTIPSDRMQVALVQRESRAVRTGVMAKRVKMRAQKLVRRRVTQEANGGGIDKGADALGIEAVDSLGSGFENQANVFFLFLGAVLRFATFVGGGTKDKRGDGQDEHQDLDDTDLCHSLRQAVHDNRQADIQDQQASNGAT